jgi:SpoVK/Ycf46/Vps4 family AAA+-type ATPase
MVKNFLQNILCRLVKVKGEIIYFNNPILEFKPCHYVFLDEYLIDLKLEPDDLEIAIPRYFREDNRDNIVERRLLLENGLKRINGNTLPEQDRTKFFYHVDLGFEDAICMLQNFEICRQNIKRISQKLKYEMKRGEKDLGGGGGQTLASEERRSIILQHLVAIQKVKKIKEEEMKFLRMKKNSLDEMLSIPALNSIGTNPTEKDDVFSNIKSPEEIRKNRKEIQKERQRDYDEYLKTLEKSINEVEGYDMKQKMINERRDWMEEYKHDHKEPPQQIKLFYDKFNVTIKQELDDNQKKEKDKIAKDKLKKEQDKKKKDEQGDKIQIKPYTGPSGIEMENIQKYINEFKALFETPSEFINQKDTFMVNIARKNVLEKVTEAIRLEVDQLISIEIANRRTIFLKGKKDRLPKAPKVKVPPEKFCTGEKPLAKVPLSELFNELIDKNVIRKMVPHTLDELQCDFNYVAHRMNIIDENLIDVPLFYTKQLIKEYLIFPLGDPFIKENLGSNIASALFHGPPGTGKTLAALAIAYHTDALFIDISPRNVEGKINTKEDLSRTLAAAFRIAKNYQPAIIYFDNAEQIFAAKAKGAIKNAAAQKMKKYIASMKNLITQNMRVLIIGCTNRGYPFLNKKDMKNIFDKTFYFGLPSYADRVKLWKNKIRAKTSLDGDLDYCVLGEMSNGYSQESIISCIEYTLSRQRMDRVKFNPIQTEEFISSLAKTEYFYKDDYLKEKEFLKIASGMDDIYNYLKEKRDENEKNIGKR